MRRITAVMIAAGLLLLCGIPRTSAQPPSRQARAAAPIVLGFSGLHGEIDEYSTRLEQLYSRELPSLAKRGHVFMGDTVAYPYFAVHPEQTVDGVHPNAAGVAALAQMWAVAYLRAAGVR